ncbi:Os04g0560100 [Oryza sativa Japonica Group]|uniref:Os04g0560100 protein n=1 Tax=Oryza sativa subsp. japonica TaxID=39947 RepID=A0A0N7KJH9_ORYSJ|nr:hypothetical protein EE612_024894 [Oryza sativa]BAS90465.1 Os04g0560100 [Oryza sativa Japonica Group]
MHVSSLIIDRQHLRPRVRQGPRDARPRPAGERLRLGVRPRHRGHSQPLHLPGVRVAVQEVDGARHGDHACAQRPARRPLPLGGHQGAQARARRRQRQGRRVVGHAARRPPVALHAEGDLLRRVAAARGAQLHPRRPRHLLGGALLVLLAGLHPPRRRAQDRPRALHRPGRVARRRRPGIVARRAAQLRGARPARLPQSGALGDPPPVPLRAGGLQARRRRRRPPRRHVRAGGVVGHVLHLLRGAHEDGVGRRLPGVPAGAVAVGRRHEVRAARLVQVRGVQRRATHLPREGPRVPADEEHRRQRAPPPPPGRGAGPPRRAEDVAHAVHEARAPDGGAPARPRPDRRRAPRRRGVRRRGARHRGLRLEDPGRWTKSIGNGKKICR